MVCFLGAIGVAAAAALFNQVSAHPGHDLSQEILQRSTFFANSKRDLNHCDAILRKRGIEDAGQKRRKTIVDAARVARGLPVQRADILRRDASNISHLSTLDITPTTSGVESIIFANSTCLLSPEGEEGPYYVKGEYIRSDISEDQPGVEVIWDLQFINVETCEPIENLTSDIWHCNSTGVYSGVIASGNGNSDDTTNIDNTFLRGLQTTDSEGVVQYTSVFPGHYSGRATHVHIETHLGGTVLNNGTYTGGSVGHVGQFFFDQDLITEVNSLSPYTANTQVLTTNAEDRIVQSELLNGADPFLSYVLLGDSVSDGLFMWITFAVNTSASYTSSPAAELTAEGGIASSGSNSGPGLPGGNGPRLGNGTAPTGTVPSSTVGNTSVLIVSSTSRILSATSTSGASRLVPFSFFI